MQITVVTVCRNAEKTITNTIESVLSQSFRDYEYIVIDGKSTDNTYDIVMSYNDRFASLGVSYKHFSESDNGIWDAMNKGIKCSNGEWIVFINADDRIHDSKVLETVFEELKENEFDVVYGDTLRIRNNSSYVGKANNIDKIVLNMPFCHQGAFARSDVMRKYLFDEKYIVADYNFFLSLYLNKGKFKKIDRIIADYSEEGYSNQNKFLTYLSTVDVRHDHGLINKNTIRQKIRNIYFKELLDESCLFHTLFTIIDNRFSRRAK